MSEGITYRACHRLEEFQQCVELQKTIWGFEDADLLPVRLFVVGHKIGGQCFAAFDGDKMVSFCISIPGLRNAKAYLHSHMLGTLPEYQNQHLGRALKLMQRDDAIVRGVSLIEWTFDPLELKNAFFNIERLGVIVRRYVPNQYGTTSSQLQSGLPSDRLVAEWWLARERFGRKQGQRRIEVPADIGAIKNRNPKEARPVQGRLAGEFQETRRKGYTVTRVDPGEKTCAYLLEKIEEPKL